MKLESQASSLELSKRLRDLGVKQESLYQWRRVKPYWEQDSEPAKNWSLSPSGVRENLGRSEEEIAAFTVAELGPLLPKGIVPKKLEVYELRITWANGKCVICYGSYFNVKTGLREEEAVWHWEHSDTEADARASMLCYLIEQKIVIVDEINRRLSDGK